MTMSLFGQHRARDLDPGLRRGARKGVSVVTVLAALISGGVAQAQSQPEGYGLQWAQRDRETINSVVAWVEDAGETNWTSADGITGLPILLKDNIETRDMPTTAGSLALLDNAPGRDAPLVARLRAAGAVILGKTNLSEWANIRSSASVSGWSGVGGQTRNPHVLDRNTCGSSSGSGAAVAAGLAPAAIGTETDGSIVCPAAINGIVGFKPTVGMVSRTHIVPISHSQDTAGPMTRSVEDAAIVLSVIAGTDPADPATAEADARKVDFRAALDAGSLRGTRIGVARFLTGYSAGTDRVFEENLQALRDAGAVLVEITEGPDMEAIGAAETTVLHYELKADLNAYLASTDAGQVKTRTLADVIAFNAATPREMGLFGQETFVLAEATTGLETPEYIAARETSLRLAGVEGIDRMLAENNVVALVAPTVGPAWSIDAVNGDHYLGAASTLPAVAGYPHLTVPMGFVQGLPVGISFIGTKWDDARILSLGYAYEQATRAIRPPTFARSADDLPDLAPLLAPHVR
ncbi:amidase [Brevundimonas subvibrioides]|uniref:Amidase n=1 Tax=Brevundimonas subvibrioides (strain ATCC 15264 / DSM 4735 / LMG 14903 / NBRC 16000 / CB 81) TaxID=633149 RepID=D9QKV2_BRESC|nr:amidase [Brevundimonas subvibrioides]ADL01766.1 Amidase [Brevundimonas subvibrioides ATCC 15264]